MITPKSVKYSTISLLGMSYAMVLSGVWTQRKKE